MSDAEQLQASDGGQLRAFVAPKLDAYEMQRLALVAGCVAVAAAANYAHSALPQPAPVAVGSAVLGILLVLRRRPRDPKGEAEVVESDVVSGAAPSLTIRGRRGSNEALAGLMASLAILERQIDAHEKRLTSLSGRQSLLHVEAREKLAEFDSRVHEIETRMSRTEEQIRLIRGHHIELLRLLNASLAQHRQSLVELTDPTPDDDSRG